MHIDEVKNNRFYQFPQWLLKEPYNVLSDKAKLIYMLLFDRRTLSEQNKWYDTDGKIYMYFTNEQLVDVLKCSNKTIVKAKKELQEANLLKEVRQGVNKPNRLYINGSVESTRQEVSFLPFGSVESTRQEVSEVHTINTNNINTNISIDEEEGGNKFLQELENLWGRTFNGMEVMKITDYLINEGVSNQLMKKAIEISLLNGARNFNYVSKVLDNWIDEGIKTPEQVDVKQKQHEKSKQFKSKNTGQLVNFGEVDKEDILF
ncbi:DnaD domain protein [Streptococcus porcinus]|uniref:Replication initiator protein A n=1 Tax=Streptococcus porcinus TaxID=1340 RepID=A0A7V9WT60_STRPO|nr:DnaD domain protein [Streptococcus porcinus]MBA2796588.1 replication initiator protein A [Streptococcus porcinus]